MSGLPSPEAVLDFWFGHSARTPEALKEQNKLWFNGGEAFDRELTEKFLPLLEALAPVTIGPASILGLPQGRIETGAPADLILFDPGKGWLCDPDHLLSRSKNSPFDGRRLQGRVMRSFVGGKTVFVR